jgi:hypothetical protein
MRHDRFSTGQSLSQGLPQKVNILRQICLFDRYIRPDYCHQFAFRNNFPREPEDSELIAEVGLFATLRNADKF